jgi:SanA protein
MKRKLLATACMLLGAGLVIGIILNIYVYAIGSRYIVSSAAKLPHEPVAIILGAAVSPSGVPSSVLEDRIVAAVALYKEGKVDKILMSGANPTITNNEVDPVRTILIEDGVPTQDIFLDHAGFNTYSSMYRAKVVFEISSAIIVSQEFHLPRAVYIARSLGIDAYGFPADRGTYALRNYAREMLARPYAFINLFIHRVPKYLGSTIPITGDGSAT